MVRRHSRRMKGAPLHTRANANDRYKPPAKHTPAPRHALPFTYSRPCTTCHEPYGSYLHRPTKSRHKMQVVWAYNGLCKGTDGTPLQLPAAAHAVRQHDKHKVAQSHDCRHDINTTDAPCTRPDVLRLKIRLIGALPRRRNGIGASKRAPTTALTDEANETTRSSIVTPEPDNNQTSTEWPRRGCKDTASRGMPPAVRREIDRSVGIRKHRAQHIELRPPQSCPTQTAPRHPPSYPSYPSYLSYPQLPLTVLRARI